MNQKLDDQLLLNPHRGFEQFALQFNIHISQEISTEEYQMLFLHLVDVYLKRKINVEHFFQFIGVLDFTPFTGTFPKPKMIIDPRTPANPPQIAPGENPFTLPEIIEFLSDVSDEDEILLHEPTLQLIEETEIESEDFPFDWPMREALRYYKKHRELLTVDDISLAEKNV